MMASQRKRKKSVKYFIKCGFKKWQMNEEKKNTLKENNQTKPHTQRSRVQLA